MFDTEASLCLLPKAPFRCSRNPDITSKLSPLGSALVAPTGSISGPDSAYSSFLFKLSPTFPFWRLPMTPLNILFGKKFSFSSVLCCDQLLLLNPVGLFAAPRTAARQVSLSFAISWSLLRRMSIESVRPSHHLILRHPVFSPAINLSQHLGLFQ